MPQEEQEEFLQADSSILQWANTLNRGFNHERRSQDFQRPNSLKNRLSAVFSWSGKPVKNEKEPSNALIITVKPQDSGTISIDKILSDFVEYGSITNIGAVREPSSFLLAFEDIPSAVRAFKRVSLMSQCPNIFEYRKVKFYHAEVEEEGSPETIALKEFSYLGLWKIVF